MPHTEISDTHKHMPFWTTSQPLSGLIWLCVNVCFLRAAYFHMACLRKNVNKSFCRTQTFWDDNPGSWDVFIGVSLCTWSKFSHRRHLTSRNISLFKPFTSPTVPFTENLWLPILDWGIALLEKWQINTEILKLHVWTNPVADIFLHTYVINKSETSTSQ